MNARHVCKWCVVGALVALGLSFGLNKAVSAQPATPVPPAPANAEQGVQVLTRGPVHEAFAETVTYDPEPGVVVPKAPPAAIEEVPPEQRLEGANVAWIPGYWAWDDERKDFLWVSGIWRDLPPGRQWVPGYWGKAGQGYQWTSGYWADAKASEVQYLPEPPATVENGPNIAASSADQTWLPGCWIWQKVAMLGGPVFGRPRSRIGIGFPPITFGPRAATSMSTATGITPSAVAACCLRRCISMRTCMARPGFSYSPTTVIDLGVFANHLFLRPQYQHYYFGDYYAADYQAAGFYPSYSYNSGRFGYDPIYAYDRWQHRQDRGWEQRQQADFQNRRDHDNLRPPRTWAGQGLQNASEATSRAGLPRVAALLDDLSRNRDSQLRFQPVDQAERQRLAQQAQDVQRFRQQRQTLETSAVGAPAETRTKEFAPAKVRLPGSPIVAKSGAELGRDHTPPKMYEAPKPDPTVVAKPRVNRAVEQPRPQPRVERAEPQPQRQPQAERHAQQPRGNEPAAADQDQRKGKDKN